MALIIFFALVAIAASSGALFKPGPWYERLEKPSWNPPDWVFPVVWTILYIFIAFAGWLVWSETGIGAAIIVWGIQLVLNAIWSALFFGLKRMDVAFVEVTALWTSIVVFIVLAWPVSTLAALLFVPYLAWVSTAALLNWTVWKMNSKATA
jgi:tryptophan-rich sensory protein